MEPLFESRQEYEAFVFNGLLRLIKVVTWLLLWLAALSILSLGLLTAWLSGLTGTEAAAALRAAWSSSTAQLLTAVGFSALSLVAGGWWTAKKLHAWLGREVLLKYVAGSR